MTVLRKLLTYYSIYSVVTTEFNLVEVKKITNILLTLEYKSSVMPTEMLFHMNMENTFFLEIIA